MHLRTGQFRDMASKGHAAVFPTASGCYNWTKGDESTFSTSPSANGQDCVWHLLYQFIHFKFICKSTGIISYTLMISDCQVLAQSMIRLVEQHNFPLKFFPSQNEIIQKSKKRPLCWEVIRYKWSGGWGPALWSQMTVFSPGTRIYWHSDFEQVSQTPQISISSCESGGIIVPTPWYCCQG